MDSCYGSGHKACTIAAGVKIFTLKNQYLAADLGSDFLRRIDGIGIDPSLYCFSLIEETCLDMYVNL